MKIEQTDTHYKITINGAGYAISKDDTSQQTLQDAADFLSGETRQSVTVTQIVEAINALKA